ncbi:DUF2716 domain-containing protein [Paenibacillus terrigena]|nr:DUF2716 domain-containing protein [Paenibacillus terrigena]
MDGWTLIEDEEQEKVWSRFTKDFLFNPSTEFLID